MVKRVKGCKVTEYYEILSGEFFAPRRHVTASRASKHSVLTAIPFRLTCTSATYLLRVRDQEGVQKGALAFTARQPPWRVNADTLSVVFAACTGPAPGQERRAWCRRSFQE